MTIAVLWQICCNAKNGIRLAARPLDGACCVREACAMTKRFTPAPTLPIAAALLALAACHNNTPTEVSQVAPDPNAEELKKRPPVELPPSIKQEATLRCKDNSLVYITFFNGDKQALVRTTETGTPVKLTAEAAGDPLKADGYVLTGTPKSVTLTQPGKPAQVCDL